MGTGLGNFQLGDQKLVELMFADGVFQQATSFRAKLSLLFRRNAVPGAQSW